MSFNMLDTTNPNEEFASLIVSDAAHGFVNKVERKLSTYDYTTYKTDYKSQALVEASALGQVKVVKILLKAGADPNVKVTSADESAFCGAIIFDRAEVVKAFIESGKVNINAPQCGTPDHKNTPLEQAHKYENKSTETIKLLVEAGADTKYLNQYNYDGNINYSGETSFIKDICQEQ